MNNHDTIWGLINYGSNYENTSKCLFKTNLQSPVVTYYPFNIVAYRFEEGKYFISKNISPSDTSKIFLEFLFDGIIKLYDYFDKSGVHYLISKTGDEFIELKNDIVITKVNGVTYQKESKEYIGVLKNLLKDSPYAVKNVENVSLELNPLIDLSEAYHRDVCPSEKCIIYAKKKVKIKFSFGLIAGVTPSTISITETQRVTGRFILPDNSSTGIILGSTINMNDPFFSRRLSIQSDINLVYNKYLTDQSSLSLLSFNVPLQIKYGISLKNSQISALAGGGLNFILLFDYFSNDYGQYNFLSGREQLCLLGGIEYSIKINSKSSIILQVKYENSKGTEHKGQWGDIFYSGNENDYNEFDTKINRIIFQFGFQF